MSRNNRGFSYVEMIIVLAILAIMVAMVTITIGTNNRNNVSRASEKLESLVNKARINALTKGTSNGYLNLAIVDGSVYAYVGEALPADQPSAVKSHVLNGKVVSGEKICSANLSIQLNGTVSDTAVNRIGFLQSTGGLGSGSPVVMVMHGTNSSSTFQIYPATGKTYRSVETSEEES